MTDETLLRRELIADIRYLAGRLNDRWTNALELDSLTTSTLRDLGNALWETARAEERRKD